MSDGRMTNYISRCELNALIMREFGIASEPQYRMFLQQEPAKIHDFLARRFNMVLPYHYTTPCVSSRTQNQNQMMR